MHDVRHADVRTESLRQKSSRDSFPINEIEHHIYVVRIKNIRVSESLTFCANSLFGNSIPLHFLLSPLIIILALCKGMAVAHISAISEEKKEKNKIATPVSCRQQYARSDKQAKGMKRRENTEAKKEKRIKDKGINAKHPIRTSHSTKCVPSVIIALPLGV